MRFNSYDPKSNLVCMVNTLSCVTSLGLVPAFMAGEFSLKFNALVSIGFRFTEFLPSYPFFLQGYSRLFVTFEYNTHVHINTYASSLESYFPDS